MGKVKTNFKEIIKQVFIDVIIILILCLISGYHEKSLSSGCEKIFKNGFINKETYYPMLLVCCVLFVIFIIYQLLLRYFNRNDFIDNKLKSYFVFFFDRTASLVSLATAFIFIYFIISLLAYFIPNIYPKQDPVNSIRIALVALCFTTATYIEVLVGRDIIKYGFKTMFR